MKRKSKDGWHIYKSGLQIFQKVQQNGGTA
jgi:hypothetical protein